MFVGPIRGIGIENCNLNNVFPLADICLGSDADTDCVVVYIRLLNPYSVHNRSLIFAYFSSINS